VGPVIDGKFARLVLTVCALILVGWLGAAALIAISIAWPANQVPHLLLGIWLGVITLGLAWPDWPDRNASWVLRVAYAPLVGPVTFVVRAVRQGRRPQGGRRWL
jgi:hypothetical protein